MGERARNTYKYVRKLLLGLFNRRFLIFLFFLALSSIFWLMMTLNETYEQEIAIPVTLVNVPKSAVLTTDVDSTIRVTVRDKGYTLVKYMYVDHPLPIKINFQTYANKNSGYGIVPSVDLQKMVLQRLIGSSKLVSVNPERVDFYFTYGKCKSLPVVLDGTVVPGKSYYLAMTKFWPERVGVYASKEILDTLRTVKTEAVHIENFNDTVTLNVRLAKVKGIKCVPSTVKMRLYPDILTEESMEVPIQAINVPEGMVLRTFPSKVSVSFTVGASLFRNVKAEQFEVVADYNEVLKKPSDKCSISLRKSPTLVKAAHLNMRQVDYLIEQQ